MVEPRDVDFMAHLARISVQSSEKKRLVEHLRILLGHMERIQTLSSEPPDLPLTSHPLDLTGILEPDVPRPGLDPEDVLSNAPDPGPDSTFRVPPPLDPP